MNEFLEGLLISSISGAFLSVLLLLAKPFVKNKISHRSQYFSWYLVFLRMLLPFSFGGIFIGNLFSLQSPSGQLSASSVSLSDPSAIAAITASSVGAISQRQVSGFANAVHNSNVLLTDWSVWLLTLWLLGAIALIDMNLISYIGCGWQIKSSRRQVKDAEILALLRECSAELKISRLLPVYVSACTDTPFLNGVFRCSIVLPDKSFTPEQLRHAFMHELTHYYRHDNLLKWLTALSISVNWFNPVIYFASREASRQCELACDEAVTAGFSRDERIRYGKTLLAVASQSDHRPFALSATMSEDKRNLKERLEVLAKAKGRDKMRGFFSVILFSVAAVITTVTLMVGCAKSPAFSAQTSADDSAGVSDYRNSFGPHVTSTDALPASGPQILGTVSDSWKSKYRDINITNEWLGAGVEEDTRYIAFAGVLKSDSHQGVVEVVTTNRDGTVVKGNQRFLCPGKNGSLTVTSVGAKDTTMILKDADGLSWNFQIVNGFDPQTPVD